MSEFPDCQPEPGKTSAAQFLAGFRSESESGWKTETNDHRAAIQTKLDCVFVPLNGVIGLFSHGAAFIRMVNRRAN